MIKVSEPIVGEREVAAVSEVLLSGRYVQGPKVAEFEGAFACLLYTSPSPRDATLSRMPSSA